MVCEVFSLCYMKSLVCVMGSLWSVLRVVFSVSGSPLKRLVAALLITQQKCVGVPLVSYTVNVNRLSKTPQVGKMWGT